jgi:hypothetical protein
MILPAILLLFASATRVEIADDVVEVPPAEWRYLELSLKQLPVIVVCHFDAADSRRLRMAFLRKQDLNRLQHDQPHGVLAVTQPGAHGSLRFRVQTPGDYAVFLDNREGDRDAAKVRLRVALQFGGPRQVEVRDLSPQRRLWVIAISFVFFFGVLAYAGRKLLLSKWT